MSDRRTILCANCDEVLTQKADSTLTISGPDIDNRSLADVAIWWCPDCKDFTLTAAAGAKVLRAGIELANEK